MQGARTIGSFFASAVSKAGKTVTEAGAKIKKTVEETVIQFVIYSLWKVILFFFFLFCRRPSSASSIKSKKHSSKAKIK